MPNPQFNALVFNHARFRHIQPNVILIEKICDAVGILLPYFIHYQLLTKNIGMASLSKKYEIIYFTLQNL